MRLTPRETRILLVEDDPEDVDYLREILADKMHFLKIDGVQSLKDALDRLAIGKYDIILTDLSLPDSRGLETFFSLQKAAGALPILVLTGLDDEQFALETLRRGAQDYLVKGEFNAPFLLKSIQYAIERNKISGELAVATQQLGEANERLNELAHNDALTSLLNRRGFEQVLSREMAWAHRHGSSTMVIIADLDDFKKINDTLGHSVGDDVLKGIAARLQEPLRATDSAARIGGDEFLVLLPDTDTAEGVRIAEKVRHSIASRPFVFGSNEIKVTMSVGAIPVEGPTLSIDDLLLETHDALYKSKRTGKNQVIFEERRRDVKRPDRSSTLIERFRSDPEFNVLVQPIFDFLKNKPVAYEFITRSSVPSLEAPDNFYRASVENNFVAETDKRCVDACLFATESMAPDVRRHLNVWPATMADGKTSELIEVLSRRSTGERFCLEINQHQIIGDPAYLMPSTQALKNAGFMIAIENVSFSQNTIEAMVLLKPDFIKIDKKIVSGINKDAAGMRSLKRLLQMAENLNIDVIAHGIESYDDFNVLRSIGVKFGQGNLFESPRPVQSPEPTLI